MNGKRSLELSDDALDGVSGGIDVIDINAANLTPLHSGTPGASGGTLDMPVLPKGTPGTVQIGGVTGGSQAQSIVKEAAALLKGSGSSSLEQLAGDCAAQEMMSSSEARKQDVEQAINLRDYSWSR